jgi:streptogramin lyase
MGLMAPGTLFAGHRIEAVVGRGGMGVVYRARQLDLDRVVALKVIAPELLEDPEMRHRFVGEARTAAAIEHPNVIPLHYVGEEDGVAFLAMRFVDGVDVGGLVRAAGPLAPARAANVAAQAGAALDAIHSAGLVHRDVKPANLMVAAADHVYLTDFGLAKHTVGRAGVTRSGQWVGTLDYVAPEQIRGGRIDARADVYALGAVLYFMLTGHVPYEHEGDEAKLWAHLTDPPPKPSRRGDGVPRALDRVVQRALAKLPEQRQPSAGDLGRATLAAVGGSVAAEPERMVARGAASPEGAPKEPGLAEEVPTLSGQRPLPEPPPEPASRKRLLAAVGALAAAAGATVLAFSFLGDGARDPPSGAVLGEATTSDTTATATPRQAARRPYPRVGLVVQHVGRRPNGVAVVGGEVWVTSYFQPWITQVSARTGRVQDARPQTMRGTLDIQYGAGSVWVASYDEGEVLRIDPGDGRVTGRIATPLPPVAVAVGDDDLWVVGRARGEDAADALLHYDHDGGLLRRYDVAEGVGPIVLAVGSLWAGARKTSDLLRVDGRTGDLVKSVGVGGPPFALGYGEGYLWATVPERHSVARIQPRSGQVVSTYAGNDPAQLAVAGDRVYVACTMDHVVMVINPRRVKPAGPPLPIKFNPFAVVAGGGHVWVTDIGANTLTRIDYR